MLIKRPIHGAPEPRSRGVIGRQLVAVVGDEQAIIRGHLADAHPAVGAVDAIVKAALPVLADRRTVLPRRRPSPTLRLHGGSLRGAATHAVADDTDVLPERLSKRLPIVTVADPTEHLLGDAVRVSVIRRPEDVFDEISEVEVGHDRLLVVRAVRFPWLGRRTARSVCGTRRGRGPWGNRQPAVAWRSRFGASGWPTPWTAPSDRRRPSGVAA